MPLNRHRLWQLAADAVMVAAAWWLAFQLRFDKGLPPFYESLLRESLPIVLVVQLAFFVGFGFYHRWWRYVSMHDMWRAVLGVSAAWLASGLAIYLVEPVQNVRLPRGVFFMDWLLLLALVTGTRLLARTLFERPSPGRLIARGKEVIVVGAGDAGQLILKEMQRSRHLGYTPIGLVDDDPRKRNGRFQGVRVLGSTAELAGLLREHRPDEVLIAIPSAAGEVRRRIVEVARAEGVPVKTLPALHELISGDLDLAGQIRPVQVEDVLGREPVEADPAAVASYLAGRTVLVTGAGGSIGAELCRQIARVGAARLVLVDNSELALFEIERELTAERGFTAGVPVLADVRDAAKMRHVFESYRPDVVFHAAAYKHVPLLEANPLECIRNNVLATRVLANVAVSTGASRFVLVSTDKAARPKNLLGQSKALGEWVVKAYGVRDDVETRFVAVRFGNVLGSSGSVIPIFRRQIEKGGPLTVTHPDMTRFFMTIPEAASLVVHAGAIGEQGEVLVLDMGEPVKILDLARNMIRLSGKEPERDVAIEFVGVRPGEKLHEVLWNEDEEVAGTSHPKILAARSPGIDAAWLDEELDELERRVLAGETLEAVSQLGAIVRSPQRTAAPAAGRPA